MVQIRFARISANGPAILVGPVAMPSMSVWIEGTALALGSGFCVTPPRTCGGTDAVLVTCCHPQTLFQQTATLACPASPDRHVRRGVSEHPRSRARPPEGLRNLVKKFDRLNYLPANPLVIAV